MRRDAAAARRPLPSRHSSESRPQALVRKLRNRLHLHTRHRIQGCISGFAVNIPIKPRVEQGKRVQAAIGGERPSPDILLNMPP
jgi:hypothetical protein